MKAKEITQDQLIRLLKDSTESNSAIHFGFILGAGASKKSGIPDGSELAKQWFNEIKEDIKQQELDQWIEEKEINQEYLAESYTKIFAKRFEVNYQAGYEELQRRMEKAQPSVGYSFLAQLLTQTANKMVLTTNFDTMVEDALFGIKKGKPLVLGHELLSQYLNTSSLTRPTIVKIHRDFLFSPYNTDENVKCLDTEWEKALSPILKEYAMIVLGYGGNDDSLMDYLKKIKDRKPIYWCYRENVNKLSDKIQGLLTDKDFIVKINGFDQFMLTVNDKLGFGNIIDTKDINKSLIVQNALEYAKMYQEQLEDLTKNLDKEEKEAVVKLLPSWWHYELRTYEVTEDAQKEHIYLEGLKAYPNSHELMNNYALLLKKLNRDEEAERNYIKALELDPNDAAYNGNYAMLLAKLNRDEESERFYIKALELNPNNAVNNSNYASLLQKLNHNEDAERYYKKALESDPNHVGINGNYASLLQKLNRDEEAERYYKKALENDPNHANTNGNYAQLLLIEGKAEEAKRYIENAFEHQTIENDLLIELWFYRLAHYPEFFEQAQQELDKLLADGYRSIGWDFSRNIARAKMDNHPDIEMLERYARQITQN